MKACALILVAFAGVSSAVLCNILDGERNWVSSQATGMTDAAYGGMTLNDGYFCFDACLASSAMILDMKVDLYNTSSPRVNHKRFSPSKVPGAVRDGDDPNAFGCIDPTLRAKIANTLTKVTKPTAKAVVQALQFNLGLKGWAFVVANFDFEVSEIVQDFHYCDYDAQIQGQYFSLLLAKIDTN